MLSERSQTQRPHATRFSLHKICVKIVNVLDKPQQVCDSCVYRMLPDTFAPCHHMLAAHPPFSLRSIVSTLFLGGFFIILLALGLNSDGAVFRTENPAWQSIGVTLWGRSRVGTDRQGRLSPFSPESPDTHPSYSSQDVREAEPQFLASEATSRPPL